MDILINFWYLWVIIIFLGVMKLFKPVIKGRLGEKTVSIILSKLDSENYKVINDIVLRVGDKTSQIDHVVVSKFGLFVIETKNYKGWITGNSRDMYWTQHIYKHKEKLYNPLLQNYSHTQALKYHLNDFPEIIYIPIVVFSINANLKIQGCSNVVYTTKLLKTIRSYERQALSSQQIDEIYSRILSLNITDKDERKKHVQSVAHESRDKLGKIKNDVCPRCGGNLVFRNGKYGSFKGCSNYPRCRFTVKG